MATQHIANEQQAALWNGAAGRGWVEAQESLDRLFEPFERLLVDRVAAHGARRVLDLGCGTGATTLAIARRLGAEGRAVGLDISAPMIELARSRAALERTPPDFVCADAQTHAFVPKTFDMIASRFGVMFFDDPIRAFANLRHAATDGAALECIVWRAAADNPFMTAAERAIAPLLLPLPDREPNAPGQFGFANPEHVRSILERAGWGGIAIEPLDVPCVLPERELDDYLTRLGPVGRLLLEADAATSRRILATLRAAFQPFVHGDEVRFDAACWTIRARAAVG